MNILERRCRSLRGRRVVVLKGGWSAEREVSLRSGAAVEQALRGLGVRVSGFDVRRGNVSELVRRLGRGRTIVFNALHGEFGEDGQVQGLLESLGVPYTGSGVLASALAMHKPSARRIFERAGLPVPPWAEVHLRAGRDTPHPGPPPRRMFHLPGGERESPEQAARRLGYPVVVKPAAQGSAVGVSIVRRAAELAGAVRRARRYGPGLILEKYLEGMEVTVGILGNRALPLIEIESRTEFYDYEAKYTPGMSRHIIPARLPADFRERIARLALRTHRALGCRAVSRVDVMVPRRGRAWGPPMVLELNTLPGLTATSLLPDAARAAGIAFPDLVLDIIRLSLR